MKLDGIEKELIIINPYKRSDIDINLQQSIQKSDLQKTDIKQSLLSKETNNSQKVTISQEELNRIMEELRHRFNMLEKYLQINIDQELQIPISKIIDMRTEEVIRQIPPEWVLEILRRIEELKGIFYSTEA